MDGTHPILSIYDKPLEWLNKLLQRDSCYRDIRDSLEIDANGKVTFSGTKELDYPSNSSTNVGEIETLKSFSLPLDLIEKFGAMQKNCLMGVFTACERAWITIDNELFMWNYEDGEDLAYYDGIVDTIVCVGLATSSPGILPERVHYLLCIATPSELFLLGMIYSETSPDTSVLGECTGSVLQVMPDPLFRLPTDAYNVSCIEGTPDGRIFLGTREGYLLEMTYGPIPNWTNESMQFAPGRTGPCSLINHSASTLSMLLPSVLTSRFRNGDSICQIAVDSDRHLLYTRTEDSYLTVFSYSEKSSNSFSRLASLSSSDLSSTASSVVRSVDRIQFRNLITIAPLSSGLCYLMAITKTGIRLYFGENLRLIHIRLPPASLCDTVGLGEVKLAVETRGTVVLVSAVPPRGSMHPVNSLPTLNSSILRNRPGQFTDSSFLGLGDNAVNNDASLLGDSSTIPPHIICSISPDPYPWTPNLTEVFSASWCVGGAWALVLLPQKDSILGSEILHEFGSSGSVQSLPDLSQSASPTTSHTRGQPPVVLTQHLDPPYRRLLLISAQGLVHLRIATPLTKLRQFLCREVLNSSLSGPTSMLASQMESPNLLFQNMDNSFLSQFLHQFSPDEAICAAVAIAANAAGGQTDLNSPNGLRFVVEQTILYFAAQASQYWTPAIVRPRPALNPSSTDQKLLGRSVQNEDKSVTSGLFLFSGLCVYLARVARTFWKSPLFRDATDVIAKCDSKTQPRPAGLGSLFRNLVQVIATVSPMGKGSRKASPEQVVISRLDTCEITWLIQQLTYLQQFIQKQLTIRGGWFRASNQQTESRTNTVQTSSDHLESVLLQRLVEELDNLLSVVLEILGFWRLLSEHVVHKIMSRLTPEHRNLAINLPFEVYASSLLDIPFGSPNPGSALFTSSSIVMPGSTTSTESSAKTSPTSSTPALGAELIGALVSGLIEYYLIEIGEEEYGGACVDTITCKLKSVCPTLFANEDAMCAKASECLIQAAVIRSNLITSLEQPNLSVNPPLSDDYISTEIAQLDRLVNEALALYIEAGPTINIQNAMERLETTGAWRVAVRLCLSVARSRDPSDVAVDCLKQGRRPSSDPLIKPNQKLSSYRLKTRRAYAESELSATEGRYDCYHRLIVCLDHLLDMAQLNSSSPSTTTTDMFQLDATASGDDLLNQTQLSKSGKDSKTLPNRPLLRSSDLVTIDTSPYSIRLTLQSILQDVVKTDDILAHFEVFGWLLSHGFTDTTVSLGSPHLEAYLRSRLRQTPDDPNLRCLLWRQLERRGARLEAAQVLEHLAVTPCRQLNLEDRLDFAARAIVAVKALPAAQQDLDYLHDLEARLEIAQLQQQLYLELSHCASQTRQSHLGSPQRSRGPPPGNDIEEALNQLSHGPLLSLSEMFTDYADRFGLHESKLHLLWISGSQDAALIKAVWRDLLRRILTSTGSQSPAKSKSSAGSPYIPKHGPNRTDQPNQQLVDLALVDCLARLGHRFLNELTSTPTLASIFFPLSEIVSILEYYAIQRDLPCTWVPNLLRDARLTCIASITEAYDDLLHSKDSIWRRPDVRERLFTAMLTVIEDFLTQTSIQLSVRHRMLQTDRLLDQITAILVDLNSETTGFGGGSGGDKDSKEKLISRLRRTHDQLQRFYR